MALKHDLEESGKQMVELSLATDRIETKLDLGAEPSLEDIEALLDASRMLLVRWGYRSVK